MTTSSMTAPALRSGWLVVAFLSSHVAWALHLMIVYPLVPAACAMGSDWPLHLVSAITVALTVSGGLFSWGLLRQAKLLATSERRRAQRARFLAWSGVAFGIAYTVVVIAEWLPVFFHGACQ